MDLGTTDGSARRLRKDDRQLCLGCRCAVWPLIQEQDAAAREDPRCRRGVATKGGSALISVTFDRWGSVRAQGQAMHRAADVSVCGSAGCGTETPQHMNAASEPNLPAAPRPQSTLLPLHSSPRLAPPPLPTRPPYPPSSIVLDLSSSHASSGHPPSLSWTSSDSTTPPRDTPEPDHTCL